MGFTIFESSTSFKPSDYGLKVGDIITVVCVGGGGSASAPGSTSSFGSYVSSPGGIASGALRYGGDGGYCPGNPISMGRSVISSVAWSGAAAGGSERTDTCPWYGGVGQTVNHWPAGGDRALFSASCDSSDGNFNGVGGKGCSAFSSGAAWNSGYKHGTDLITGGGGAGYGAGGGGIYCYTTSERGGSDSIYRPTTINYKGGGSGSYKMQMIKLTSTSSIAITIGAGGAGSTATYYGNGSNKTSGYHTATWGSGAPGCVCVYW